MRSTLPNSWKRQIDVDLLDPDAPEDDGKLFYPVRTLFARPRTFSDSSGTGRSSANAHPSRLTKTSATQQAAFDKQNEGMPDHAELLKQIPPSTKVFRGSLRRTRDALRKTVRCFRKDKFVVKRVRRDIHRNRPRIEWDDPLESVRGSSVPDTRMQVTDYVDFVDWASHIASGVRKALPESRAQSSASEGSKSSTEHLNDLKLLEEAWSNGAVHGGYRRYSGFSQLETPSSEGLIINFPTKRPPTRVSTNLSRTASPLSLPLRTDESPSVRLGNDSPTRSPASVKAMSSQGTQSSSQIPGGIPMALIIPATLPQER